VALCSQLTKDERAIEGTAFQLLPNPLVFECHSAVSWCRVDGPPIISPGGSYNMGAG